MSGLSVERPRSKVYSFEVEIHGIKFRFKYDFSIPGWTIHADNDDIYLTVWGAKTNSKSLLTSKVVEQIAKEIAKAKCQRKRGCIKELLPTIDKSVIVNTLKREVVSKLAIEDVSPTDGVIIPPLYYVPNRESPFAVALVGTTHFDMSLLLAVKSGSDISLEEVDLAEALARKVTVGRRRYFVFWPWLKRDFDMIELAKTLRKLYDPDLLPFVNKVKNWFEKAKGNPLAWFKWLVGVVGQYANSCLLTDYPEREHDIRLLQLLFATYLFAYVFDVPPVTLVWAPHGGASVDILPSMLRLLEGYAGEVFYGTTLSGLKWWRLVTGIMWNRLAIDKKTRRALRLLKRSFASGCREPIPCTALILADTPIARSMFESLPNTMEIRLQAPDWWIRNKIERETAAPNGERVTVTFRDFSAISVAVYLVVAHDVRNAYESLKTKPWKNIPHDTFVRYLPMATIAKLLGEDFVQTLRRQMIDYARKSGVS